MFHEHFSKVTKTTTSSVTSICHSPKLSYSKSTNKAFKISQTKNLFDQNPHWNLFLQKPKKQQNNKTNTKTHNKLFFLKKKYTNFFLKYKKQKNKLNKTKE